MASEKLPANLEDFLQILAEEIEYAKPRRQPRVTPRVSFFAKKMQLFLMHRITQWIQKRSIAECRGLLGCTASSSPRVTEALKDSWIRELYQTPRLSCRRLPARQRGDARLCFFFFPHKAPFTPIIEPSATKNL